MKRKERLRYYSLYTVIFAVLSFLVFSYSSKMEDPSSMNQMEKMGFSALYVTCIFGKLSSGYSA